ncbi:amino acid permease [Tubulinosema ratisbonensis]|uniref:Amino acid permease n=1 Tax=Tubulinosema ratisbonensis TaxID=291195 RepID=A0A437ANN4_9MICR|nr:amino acid permease [Tubulinosema ratisbonensis]
MGASETVQKLNNFDAIRALVSCMFGVGVLTVPRTFELAGVLGGLLCLGLSCLVTLSTCYFLCESTRREKSKARTDEGKPKEITYASLVKNLNKKFAPKILNIITVLICYLTTLAYFLFLVNFVSILIRQFPFQDLKNHILFDYVLRAILSLIFTIILGSVTVFIDSIQRLSKLGYATLIGVFGSLFLVLGFSFFIKNPFNSFSLLGEAQLFAAIPSFIFATCCQTLVVVIYLNLKIPTKNNVISVLSSSVLIAFLAYGFIGVCGYYVIGRLGAMDFLSIMIDKQSLFMKSLSPLYQSIVFYSTLPVVLLFIIGLCGSFASQNFVGRNSLLELIRGNENATLKDRFKIAVIQFLIYSLIAIFNIPANLIVSLVGATAMPFVCIIFPSILYARRFLQKKRTLLILPSLLCLFGILVFFYSTIQTIKLAVLGDGFSSLNNTSFNSTELFLNSTLNN